MCVVVVVALAVSVPISAVGQFKFTLKQLAFGIDLFRLTLGAKEMWQPIKVCVCVLSSFGRMLLRNNSSEWDSHFLGCI